MNNPCEHCEKADDTKSGYFKCGEPCEQAKQCKENNIKLSAEVLQLYRGAEMKYKIGQIITTNQDIKTTKALSEEPIIIPKGTKIIIGADKLAHHIKNGMMQPISKNSIVEGYDAQGLAEYLYMHLRTHFEIDEMLENYEESKEQFMSEIEYALNEIGF